MAADQREAAGTGSFVSLAPKEMAGAFARPVTSVLGTGRAGPDALEGGESLVRGGDEVTGAEIATPRGEELARRW